MKKPNQRFLATSIALTLSGVLSAQTLYWDTNGATPGAGNPADGTWDDTILNWSTDSTGSIATGAYSAGSDVVFSAGTDAATGSVTVSGTQQVSSLTFKNGSVVIDGSSIDDDGDGRILITVNSGATGTLNSQGTVNADFNIEGDFFANAIIGGSSMSKTGAGTATFNRLDASLTINQGTVIYTGTVGAKLKNTVINDTGSLQLTGNAFDGSKRSVTVNAGGSLSLSAGLSQKVGNLSGAGSLSGGAGSILDVGGDNKNVTFSGSIGEQLNMRASGTGSFTLNDTSSMTFTILGDGVNNGIIGDGVNNTTTNLDGEFIFDLSGADLTDGNSWLIVDVAALNETFGGTFNIASFTEDSGIWTYNSDSGLTFSEGTGMLSYTIPEPSIYALLLGLAVVGVVYRRRRS